jgi:hypothetical protein
MPIARGQPKRLLNVPLHILVAPLRMLPKPDEPMCFGKISIQRQRPMTKAMPAAAIASIGEAREELGQLSALVS